MLAVAVVAAAVVVAVATLAAGLVVVVSVELVGFVGFELVADDESPLAVVECEMN